MTKVEFEKNSVWLRVISRKYINKCLSFQEVNIWWGGIFHLSGGVKHTRQIKKTTVVETSTSVGKRIDLAFDAITSFSSYPLKFIFYFGIFIMISSAIAISIILFTKLVIKVPFSAGWRFLYLFLYCSFLVV